MNERFMIIPRIFLHSAVAARRILAVLFFVTLTLCGVVAGQECPSNEFKSPNAHYCVKLLNTPADTRDENNLFTIAIYRNERCLSKYPTSGYLLNALWNPDSSLVAVNNRRGNAGDYVWIIRLSDGVALKKPADAVSENFGEKYADNLMKHVVSVFPEMASKRFLKFVCTATRWDTKTQIEITNKVIFQEPRNNAFVITDKYLIETDRLRLLSRRVLREE